MRGRRRYRTRCCIKIAQDVLTEIGSVTSERIQVFKVLFGLHADDRSCEEFVARHQSYSSVSIRPCSVPYGRGLRTRSHTLGYCQTGVYDQRSDLADAS